MHFCKSSPKFLRTFRFFGLAVAIISSLLIADVRPSFADNIDVGVESILAPTGSASREDLVTVTVRVRNFSGDAIAPSEFQLSFRVDSGTWYTEIPSGALIPGNGTFDYSFNQRANLSVRGSHQIQARTFVDADSNTSNDSVSVSVITTPVVSSSVEISSFPYFEGFESGAANWTASDVGNSTEFELGTPASPTINSAATGVNSWKTELTGSVARPTRAQVISPIFDLESIPLVDISLSVWWESPQSDGAALQRSSDGGFSWTTVGAAGEPNNWYNTTTPQGLSFAGAGAGWAGYRTAGDPGFSNNRYRTSGEPGNVGYATAGSVGSDTWLTARNSIAGGAKTKFRIVYGTVVDNASKDFEFPTGGGDDGFAFDNFGITEAATANRSVTFVLDADSDGRADPGDTLLISTTVSSNSQFHGLTNVVFSDLLSDTGLELQVGTVATSVGTVGTGNTSGDTTVVANVGSLGIGGSALVSFVVKVGALTPTTETVCAQADISANEFTVINLKSNDPSTSDPADPNCLAGFIDADDDGSVDGADPDNDGLTNAEELALGTDPDTADTDGDGVDDGEEMADGTDPLEESSFLETLGTGFCVDWNGFLKAQGFTQIFEQRNTSNGSITLKTSLYDINGVQKSTTTFSLVAGAQRDTVLNSVVGYEDNTYGLVCTQIISGPPNAVDGQLVSYRFTNGSYSLAFVDALVPGRTGALNLNYNTFQPSLNADEQNNFVAGWLEISIDELPSGSPTTSSGDLTFFDLNGTAVRNQTVSVTAGQPKAVDIHSLGASKIGLITWSPANNSVPYRIRQKRYYTTAPAGQASDFQAVASIAATRGTGSLLSAPVDVTGKTAAIEISNVTGASVNAVASIIPANGSPVTQVVFTLAPRSTRHVVVNPIIASGLANIRVDSSVESSLIGSVYLYGRADDLSLSYAEALTLDDGSGAVVQTSYNSFLEQTCKLLVSNRTSIAQNSTVSMTRFDGTVLINSQPLSVPANGVAQVDICSAETQEAYGTVVLTPANPGSLVGALFRQNKEGTVEFSVAAK